PTTLANHETVPHSALLPHAWNGPLVAWPGVMLAIFTAIATVNTLAALISGRFATATMGLLLAAIFGGLLTRFLYDFLPRRAWLGAVCSL
ncbi:MAG TPA: hypothetical protein VIV12_05370, partial [Streptosporangiaceae bacterium]